MEEIMANNFKFEKFLNFIAYVAIVFVALAVLLGWLWPDLLILRRIAEIIAYFITAISAFYFARSKRNVWVMISYVVACILIIVFLILGVTIK